MYGGVGGGTCEGSAYPIYPEGESNQLDNDFKNQVVNYLSDITI